MCVSVHQGDSILLGEVVHVPQGPVTVEDLDLVDADGVGVFDAVVLPLDRAGIVSSVDPPVDYPPWESQKPVMGAQLEAGKTYNLVVRASRFTNATASSRAMSLTYRMEGVQYTTTGTTRYTLKDACF